MRCRVGPFGLAFDVEDPPLAQALTDRWSAFSGDAAAPLQITVHVDERPVHRGVRTLPLLEAHPRGFAVRGPDFEAELSADLREATVRQGRDIFPVEVVAKLALASSLLRRGGLLVHGVALAAAGRAALFTGESGAGKSTLGQLASNEGLLRIADELVAVVPEEGFFLAHGTPWNVGSPASAKLSHVGLLRWDASHHLDPSPAADVLRTLLGNALLPEDTAEGRRTLFTNAAALLRAVKPVALSFALKRGVAEVVGAALQED